MHPRDLADYFKVIHFKSTASYLAPKPNKLRLNYHLSLNKNTHHFDLPHYDAFCNYILKDWYDYTAQEQKIFIEFLLSTPQVDIIKALLEHKIHHGHSGISGIYHSLNQFPEPPKLLTLVVDLLATHAHRHRAQFPIKFNRKNYKFNFKKDNFETVPLLLQDEFIKQVLECPLQKIKLILSAQQNLNVNTIPHLLVILKEKHDDFCIHENYFSLIHLLQARLRQLDIEDVEIHYQPRVMTEKKSYIESIVPPNELEGNLIFNESFAEIKEDIARKRFITELLTLTVEKQKECLKKQYLLHSKNIPQLIDGLIHHEKTTSPLYREACALQASDCILKAATNLMDQHFLDNFTSLDGINSSQMNIEDILPYFSSQDQTTLRSLFHEIDKNPSWTEIIGRKLEMLIELDIETTQLYLPISVPYKKTRRSSFSEAYTLLWNKITPASKEEKSREHSSSVSISMPSSSSS